MKILVCIKQVPDMEARFKVNSDGVWYEEADLAFRMNEYDEYAVEQAVQLKEKIGNQPDLTVISIGPGRVVETIKKALAMGCDRGVHIQDNEYYLKDPRQIASIIAGFAKDKNFDLIFTGMQSQDRGSAQVGVIVAELLGYSCATTVVGFDLNDGVIAAKRELEGGLKSVIRMRLPAVVTCQLGLNTPRYPTLPNIMKAKKKELLALQAADYLKGDKVSATGRFYLPDRKGTCLILEGDMSEMAERLIGILKEKTPVVK